MKRTLTGALALFASVSATAQTLPLWEAGVVVGAVTSPAYPGAAEKTSRALALPFFVYRGEVIRTDQGGIGARVVHTDRVDFDVGFAGSLPSHDVAAREGMPDLGLLLEFGPRLKYLIANPTPSSRLRIELPLRAVFEVHAGVRRQGTTFEPRLVWDTRENGSPFGYDLSVGAVFGDRGINRYLYDVAPQYATATRPSYSASAGLMLVRAGASASYRFRPDVRVYVYAREESYAGTANLDSPLVKGRNGASFGVGVRWTLGRSARNAVSAQ
ncbi:MipA/OmpV family protein [Massilia sp. R2A-15]|uniref:MipA/OmpV family protein n=1 Tax=Massilia sp. R2A-15 TaxID=3064278 RepID=UPI0027344E45|nr:MipA/OmpV family protein [Massilia sp. R2A-15]WLI89901.1 MipA/OmpV family protein [Massilia sp. R2A-15]